MYINKNDNKNDDKNNKNLQTNIVVRRTKIPPVEKKAYLSPYCCSLLKFNYNSYSAKYNPLR